jgi:hypothetical protein
MIYKQEGSENKVLFFAVSTFVRCTRYPELILYIEPESEPFFDVAPTPGLSDYVGEQDTISSSLNIQDGVYLFSVPKSEPHIFFFYTGAIA